EQSACPQLLLDSFKNENVSIYRHANREDEPGDTRQRECYTYQFEDSEGRGGIKYKRQVGQQSRQAVVQEHEQNDDAYADTGCNRTFCDRVLSQGWPDDLFTDRLE